MRIRHAGVDPCSVPGCENKIKALGLCGAHWFRLKHAGGINASKPVRGSGKMVRLLKDERGEYAAVSISKGYETLVDLCDLDVAKSTFWFAVEKENTVYARGSIEGKNKFLHRILLSVPDELLTDHADGNGLNNRRHNIRIATASQNQANRRTLISCKSSKYKGVTWDKSRGLWKVSVNHKSIGRFGNELDAAKAYDSASRAANGEFSKTNFQEAA